MLRSLKLVNCSDKWLAVRTHVFIRWSFASANHLSMQIKILEKSKIFYLRIENYKFKKIVIHTLLKNFHNYIFSVL